MEDQRVALVIQGKPEGSPQLSTGTTLVVLGYSRTMTTDPQGQTVIVETMYVRLS